MTEVINQEWVWNNISSELSDELVKFWLDEKALSREDQARKRVPEVIMVVRDESESLIGITTQESKPEPKLGHEFLFWRQFVKSAYRNTGIASQMGMDCWNRLDVMHSKGEIAQKGIIVEVRNQMMNKHLKKAVLSPMPFVLYGFSAEGNQLRVCYFSNATV